MKLVFKKEVKHSVVYGLAEADPELAPVRSMYVDKSWLVKQGLSGNTWPRVIEVDVRVAK